MKIKQLNKTENVPKDLDAYPLAPEVCYKTLFDEGDTVILLTKSSKYSSDLRNIVGKTLTVRSSKFTDLGEGIVEEIMYLKQTNGVKNPYLAKHFKKI